MATFLCCGYYGMLVRVCKCIICIVDCRSVPISSVCSILCRMVVFDAALLLLPTINSITHWNALFDDAVTLCLCIQFSCSVQCSKAAYAYNVRIDYLLLTLDLPIVVT